jgi:hypothetical protein
MPRILSAYAGQFVSIVPKILELHAEPGSRVLGAGNIWRDISEKKYEVSYTDDFPFDDIDDNQFDCVFLCPLFKNNIFCDEDYQNFLDLHHDHAREASRVLRSGGLLIVKCKDHTVEGLLRLTHIDIVNKYTCSGFYIKDLFIQVKSSTAGRSERKKQRLASKNHSYFLVFAKEKEKKRRAVRIYRY